MLQDLHSHTYYSFCGKDKPEVIIEKAIDAGLDVFGITDHNYGIQYGRIDVFLSPRAAEVHDTAERMLTKYFDHMNLLKEKYEGKIRFLRGIEICTLYDGQGFVAHTLPDSADISYFDYCLIENVDHPISITKGDLFAYAKRCGCPAVGVAHTDLFAHIEKLGEDPLDYFKRMADQNIFWEMNVSYDSIHNYREHKYMLHFFEDEKQQEIVRKSGVRVSVGFDGHRTEDYLPDRVKGYCRKLTELGIKMPFEE